MLTVATFIVDRRNLFFLLIAIGVVFGAIASGWVSVENDLSAYLTDDTETRQGLDLMEQEFVTYGTAKIMATNINYATADTIAAKIRSRPDVAMLEFDDSDDHYNNFSALYSVTFKYAEDDEKALESLAEVEDMLKGYDLYVSTGMGDQQAEIISSEMQTVSVIVAVIVVIVLIITSQTWAEIPVLLLTFGASAIIASGTNFLLGTISFVSNSVTIVLQLALSIDYAVIFCNRFKEEHQTLGIREADIIALSKAIPEICASSLTTIGGLIAMMFMQYGIGPDMAVCLIKAIGLSLLSVFTFMPGLLMLFGKAIDKTKHKSFIPKITIVGKFDYLTRFIVPPAFVALIIGAFLISNKCPYVYGYSTLTTPVKNDIQISKDMIEETFGKENKAAIMVPKIDYDTEGRFIKDLEECPEVDKIVGLANTEAMDDYTLTDKITARQFSELMGVDYDLAKVLYTAYAIDDENYGKILNGASSYAIPLIDIVEFLHDEVEDGYVTLDRDTESGLNKAYDTMMIAKNQLQGENYSRILIFLNLPEEGDETFGFIDEIHEMGKKYYDSLLMAGESTSQYDLKRTFARDNAVVNWVSIFAVLVVLLFAFMSVGMPILLILVIQGSIWLNFSYPTIKDIPIFFMCYLIVSSIQMGANIDYAIVISGRFLELKDKMSKKDAIIETMNFAFPTIVTSGSMLALAGLAIGSLSSDPSICGIGQCIARGTVISIVLVMFVLPQILLLGEKIIDASSFKVSVPVKVSNQTGLIRVDGMVRGDINGHFVGEMRGIIRGNASVMMATGVMKKVEDAPEEEEGMIEEIGEILDAKAEEIIEDSSDGSEKSMKEGEASVTSDDKETDEASGIEKDEKEEPAENAEQPEDDKKETDVTAEGTAEDA